MLQILADIQITDQHYLLNPSYQVNKYAIPASSSFLSFPENGTQFKASQSVLGQELYCACNERIMHTRSLTLARLPAHPQKGVLHHP